MILLGSLKPWESNPEKWQQVFEREQPRRDLAEIRINSPVALWARQIASQRSAFAIPGDGPVQTDEFPILEYAAPEAFFIGQSSERLSMFDERTVQFPLAEPSKIRAMRSLSDKALVESFSFYGTENPDMKLYLTAVLSRPPGQPLRIDPMGHIIFRPPESYPETPQVNTNISPEFKTCIELEAKLLRDETNWKTHATEITRFLTGQIAQNKVQFRDFSPASFASLVARFAIGHGDYQLALEALRLGFVFNSKDEQLQFLSRVTDRIVPPDVMRDFKKRDKNPDL